MGFRFRFKSGAFSWDRMADVVVRNSRFFAGCLVLMTLLMILPATRIQVEGSGVSFTLDDSEETREYRDFVASFGTDDYVLLAVQNDLKVGDPEFNGRMARVNRELGAMASVLKVIDFGTLESSGLFKLIPGLHFGDQKTIADLLRIIPGVGRLISRDMKTLGFIVQIDNEQVNGFVLEKQIRQMKQVIVAAFPEHPRCYAAGIPVLRAAFERHNLTSAIVFGSLGLLFGTLTAFYIFKTLWAGIMVFFASLGSMIWTLGIMGIFSIPLNPVTGLSFGFILIGASTTVFHFVSTYFDHMKTHSPDPALEKTFATVLGPCFMCALTTCAGFFSLTLSPVNMVCQAGIIISTGVMAAFLLTVCLVSFCLPRIYKSHDAKSSKMKGDGLDDVIQKYLVAGFKFPGLSVGAGILFLIATAWAIPGIHSTKHLTQPMIKTTPEFRELHFIESNLVPPTSFSIVLTCRGNSLDSRKFWYDLYQFEKELRAMPGVQGVESLTSLIFHLARKPSPAGIRPEMVFQQILSQDPGNDLIRTYVDPALKKLRLIVHIQNQTSQQMEIILKQVEINADNAFARTAEVSLSGQLILLKSHTTELVSSQVKSLFPVLAVITLMMMFQLKSIVLGLMSLIPNVFPLVTIFGIMGWFHIPIDPLTSFAAVISFGLSVDDSIHFLTQFKREIKVSSESVRVENSLRKAWDTTARALVSTTAVLFLSCLGLLFSSFSHVVSLGILIASASVMALIGDLVFMPALVLKLRPLNRWLSSKIK